MNQIKAHWKLYLIVVLICLNVFVWSLVHSRTPRDYVTVSYLDVGQGDSILIESKNRNRILIDGGPNNKILGALGSMLPFFNNDIDVVLESHPDSDHIGGLPEVVSRYTVKNFIEPGVESPNTVDDELHGRIEGKNIPHYLARAGEQIDMGDGSYVKILFPDRDVSGLETNDASIVAQYWYGDTCFLLTGDSPSKMEDYLVSKYKDALKCNVLKAGHHGSRTSTDNLYLDTVKPSIAIISAGKGNSYGHPHKETIERIRAHGIEILSTIEKGTISLISDGKIITEKSKSLIYFP